MKNRYILICALFLPLLKAISETPATEKVYPGFTGNVFSALEYIGKTYQKPFIAECDASSKTIITLKSGPLSFDGALTEVLNQSDLKSKEIFGIPYVSDSSLSHNKADQLNHVFSSFSVPSDADGFLHILRARLANDVNKKPGDPSIGGFAMSSLVNPALKDKLAVETVSNISARALLQKEAARRAFWAVVCYARPMKPAPRANSIPTDGVWSWGETKL